MVATVTFRTLRNNWEVSQDRKESDRLGRKGQDELLSLGEPRWR